MADRSAIPGQRCIEERQLKAFGKLPDGRTVNLFTIGEADDIQAEVLDYGATLRSLTVPDSTGRHANVVLGLPRLEDYLTHSDYLGATIGRNANRLAGSQFLLEGRRYDVSDNANGHSLHGGAQGFDRKLWSVGAVSENCLTFKLISPDGDQGYPGTLAVSVRYSVHRKGTLQVDYEATTDQPTLVNLTNHSYFNLAGEGSGTVLDHVATVYADYYLPVGTDLLPLGDVAPVSGTAFDFRKPHTLGERIRQGSEQLQLSRGYDHVFLLSSPTINGLRRAARLEHRPSGRVLEVWTTEPALDLYTGNYLDGSLVGVGGAVYRQSDGIALEPEHFGNAPHMPDAASTVLRPGETYRSTTEYRFSTVAQQDGAS